MEDEFTSKLDEQILEFYKLVDNITGAEQRQENILRKVDELLKRWEDNNYLSSFVSFAKDNKNAGKAINKRVVEKLHDTAKSMKLDEHILNTYINSHGTLDLGTFITVPKNTIIITFVNEGRMHYDYYGLEQDYFKSKAASLSVLWMKYIMKALACCRAQNVSLKKTAEFYQIIKKFIVGFVEIKNKYLERFNYQLGSDYALINRDIVAYYENDIIPNQLLTFSNLPLYGITEWNIFLENMFGYPPSGKFVQVSDTNNPFFGIFDFLSQNPSVSKGAEKSKVKRAEALYLVDIIYEMEKRLAEKFPDSKDTVRPINVIVLGACRGATFITLKPQHSFLFKNLAYHLRNRMQTYAEQPRFIKGSEQFN